MEAENPQNSRHLQAEHNQAGAGGEVTRREFVYHVPVHADIGEIDVSATDIPDTKLEPLGTRGVSEIGITGTGAATRLSTRFFTPRASAFGICLSRPTNCFNSA